uniref:Class I SAM-dependent methyltransferase n=1 Tax=Desulfobacca acetoxidans TaxID=60893 RepID=A0A7V4G9B6_9BACT
MSKPEPSKSQARLDAETARIREAYARRQCGELYSWFNPAHLFIMQERERRVLGLFKKLGLTRLSGLNILEVGCGEGNWLMELVKWGARPERLTGVDILPDRLTLARRVAAPGVGLVLANGVSLPFPAGIFDIVLQSMAFTSILDPAMKQAVAREMLRVVKPSGLILWYDYFVDNPWNPDVKGVRKGEIRRLFPGCRVEVKRITLAPPLARLLAPYSYLLCYLLEKLRVLNTHYLGTIRPRP